MRLKLIFIVVVTALFSCKTTKNTTNSETSLAAQQYLALGDSYTIGKIVELEGSFPQQLVAAINAKTESTFDKPRIIAKTGWRTDELLAAMKVVDEKYDLVSVLIGVNNQYQGNDTKRFESDFRIILKQAISFSKNRKEGVFVYSIPNYGVMPFMRGKNVKKVRNELKAFNAICNEVAKEFGVSFYNITGISEKAAFDTKLIADDKRHPSKFQYKLWVDETVNQIIANQIR